jgi:hypothetical protein
MEKTDTPSAKWLKSLAKLDTWQNLPPSVPPATTIDSVRIPCRLAHLLRLGYGVRRDRGPDRWRRLAIGARTRWLSSPRSPRGSGRELLWQSPIDMAPTQGGRHAPSHIPGRTTLETLRLDRPPLVDRPGHRNGCWCPGGGIRLCPRSPVGPLIIPAASPVPRSAESWDAPLMERDGPPWHSSFDDHE